MSACLALPFTKWCTSPPKCPDVLLDGNMSCTANTVEVNGAIPPPSILIKHTIQQLPKCCCKQVVDLHIQPLPELLRYNYCTWIKYWNNLLESTTWLTDTVLQSLLQLYSSDKVLGSWFVKKSSSLFHHKVQSSSQQTYCFDDGSSGTKHAI